MTITFPLPRFVVPKPLARGRIGFYWELTSYYRKQGCTIPSEPLGCDYSVACGPDGKGGRAAALIAQFDEWRNKLAGEVIEGIAKYGTVDWLLGEQGISRKSFAAQPARL